MGLSCFSTATSGLTQCSETLPVPALASLAVEGWLPILQAPFDCCQKKTWPPFGPQLLVPFSSSGKACSYTTWGLFVACTPQTQDLKC